MRDALDGPLYRVWDRVASLRLTGEWPAHQLQVLAIIEEERAALAARSEPGWWHPPECIDIHDDDHNCLDAGGSIIGWREYAALAETEPKP